MTKIITGRGCGSCKHVLKIHEEGRALYYCRRNPPHVFAMFGPHPVTRQPVMTRQDSVFPLVEPDWHCGEYVQSIVGGMN